MFDYVTENIIVIKMQYKMQFISTTNCSKYRNSVQYNLNDSKTDGSFTVDELNLLYLVPRKFFR